MSTKSEIKFIFRSVFRNYLNPSINMKIMGKNTTTHLKYDKPPMKKNFYSKVSTDVITN